MVHRGARSRAAGASRAAFSEQLRVNSRPWLLAWLVRVVNAAMETLLMLVHIGGLGFLGWGAYLAFTQSDHAERQDGDEPVETRE
jgi:threonine/homoserine/homoserine lactone efflux protein